MLISVDLRFRIKDLSKKKVSIRKPVSTAAGTWLFVFVRAYGDSSELMRTKEFFMLPQREEITREGNDLACIVAPNHSRKLSDTDLSKASKRGRRRHRLSRERRETQAEQSKYGIADCRDGGL